MKDYSYIKVANLIQLETEIKNSAITIAEHHIDGIINDQIIIWFQTDLSSNEIAILDALVAAHIPQAIVNPAQEVSITSDATKSIDTNTGYTIFQPKPVSGTIYFPFINFRLGDNSSLKQPSSPNDVWSIDTSISGVTKVLFSPLYSYFIDGGGVKLEEEILTTDINISLLIAPNPPQGYPGNQILLDNYYILEANRVLNIEAPAKYIKYYSFPETLSYLNQVMIIVNHNTTDHSRLQFHMRIYK